MKRSLALETELLEQLLLAELSDDFEAMQANLTLAGAGQRLAVVADQFTLTPEDIDDLERSMVHSVEGDE